MTKKILASVLAIVSVLSVSATAFAVEAPDKTKEITKPGEAEYEAGVSVMGAELSVELPGNMKAFLNPYGAEVTVSEGTSPAKNSDGILSWDYEIVNNTEDFGIFVDVKKAKATPSTGTTIVAPGATGTTGKKQAAIVLKAGSAACDVAFNAAQTTSVAATDSTQGVFVFSTTEASLMRFAYAPAKTDKGSGKVYIGIRGELETGDPSAATPIADPEWTDEDTINCTFTLKINPAKKTQGAAFGVLTAESADEALATFVLTDTNNSGATIPTYDIATNAYTITNVGGNSETYDATFTVAKGYTVTTSVTSGSGTATVTGNGITFALSGLNTADNVFKVTVTNDDEATDTTDYTFTFKK